MADILIRGIGLPRQGLKVVAIHSNGHVYADTSDPGFLNKIADVIELPEHGGLIDRDAIAFEDDIYGWRDKKIVKAAPVIVPSNKEETE